MLITLSILAAVFAVTTVILLVAALAQRKAIARLSAERENMLDRLRTLESECAGAQARVAAWQEQFRNEQQMQEALEQKFDLLAHRIFDEKSRQFKEGNKESLETLLKPFRENISEFKERVEKIYAEQNLQTGALKSEIKNLLDLNRKITEETTNLTQALRGNSKAQGDWGEMILETILESSNLVNGIHYTTQHNLKGEEGNNLRPDVILNLPEKKQIIIDSKVSLTGFVNYCNEEEPAARDRALKDHLRSMRAHVDELGGKRYQNLVNSPDFVIMFVPNEPAFMAALQNDPQIWSDAYNKKVIISSPTNLFALLKIVDDLWKRDSQGKNALAIAKAGGDLYDKFVGFAETLVTLGKNIETTSGSYQKAMNQLKEGKGNLVGRSEKLRALGIKANRGLPASLEDFEEEPVEMEAEITG